MSSARSNLRNALQWASLGGALAVLHEFFVKYAEQKGWYDNLPARVESAMTWLSTLVEPLWVKFAITFIVGMTAGSWLDAFLRRREATALTDDPPKLGNPNTGRRDTQATSATLVQSSSPQVLPSMVGADDEKLEKRPAFLRFSIDQHGQATELEKENVASWSIIQKLGAGYIDIEVDYIHPLPTQSFSSAIEGEGVRLERIKFSLSQSRFRLYGDTKGRWYRIDAGKPMPQLQAADGSSGGTPSNKASVGPKGSPEFMLQAFAAERAEMVRLIASLASGFHLDKESYEQFLKDINRLKFLASFFPSDMRILGRIEGFCEAARFRALASGCLNSVQAVFLDTEDINKDIKIQRKFLLESIAASRQSFESLKSSLNSAITLHGTNVPENALLSDAAPNLSGGFSIIEQDEGTIYVAYLESGLVIAPNPAPSNEQIKKWNEISRKY